MSNQLYVIYFVLSFQKKLHKKLQLFNGWFVKNFGLYSVFFLSIFKFKNSTFTFVVMC